MDALKSIDAFARVVDLGSFSAAARAMGTTQSHVSKLVGALERRLGAPLLERNARMLVLTEQGQRYHDRALGILDAVREAEDDFGTHGRAIRGRLRIAASPAFGRSQIIPALPELLATHRELQVDLRLSDRSIDLAREGVDFAFRVAKLRDSDLISRRIGQAPRQLVASPAYLARFGRPSRPEDLARHDCLFFSGINAPRIWRFHRGGKTFQVDVRGRFSADASDAVREAAVQGLGVAVLPAWVLQDNIADGLLEPLLPNYELTPLPVHAVMLRSIRHMARVRTALDFFAARFVRAFGEARQARDNRGTTKKPPN